MGSGPITRNRLLPGESRPACRFPVQLPTAGSRQQNCQLCRLRSPAPHQLGQSLCGATCTQRAQRARRASARPAAVPAGHPPVHAQFASDDRSAGVSFNKEGAGLSSRLDRTEMCAAA